MYRDIAEQATDSHRGALWLRCELFRHAGPEDEWGQVHSRGRASDIVRFPRLSALGDPARLRSCIASLGPRCGADRTELPASPTAGIFAGQSDTYRKRADCCRLWADRDAGVRRSHAGFGARIHARLRAAAICCRWVHAVPRNDSVRKRSHDRASNGRYLLWGQRRPGICHDAGRRQRCTGPRRRDVEARSYSPYRC